MTRNAIGAKAGVALGAVLTGCGTVRGVALAPILRHQPGDKRPAMYERIRQ